MERPTTTRTAEGIAIIWVLVVTILYFGVSTPEHLGYSPLALALFCGIGWIMAAPDPPRESPLSDEERHANWLEGVNHE